MSFIPLVFVGLWRYMLPKAIGLWRYMLPKAIGLWRYMLPRAIGLWRYMLPRANSIFLFVPNTEMLQSLAQRPAPANTNRERRPRYQHPKGAPNADLIFKTGGR
jgi:hypothetical protein